MAPSDAVPEQRLAALEAEPELHEAALAALRG
jgi:hypothetical protein